MVNPSETQAQRNYWKMAFLFALLAFEIARETAVLAMDSPPESNASFHLFRYGDYAVAEGRWQRIDGGEELLDTAVTIQCSNDIGGCIEATAKGDDQFYYAPSVDRFTAKFEENAITYENDSATCVKYIVRMDFEMKSVIATRTKKDVKNEPVCEKLENAIRMQLASSVDVGKNRRPDDKHFVPLVTILMTVFSIFN